MPASLTSPTVRQLPAEEWARLLDLEPFASGGLPDPEHWRIIVAEVDGRIVGFCGLFNTVHWDPWWIDQAYQKHPAVFGGLLRAGLGVLTEFGVQTVHTTVPDIRPDLQALVEHFGFIEAPGKLYVLYVPDAVDRST
jgi:hypothetical protein